ncbi:P1 family peptidase [Flexibacterium corallicola]|uniref:P1 family peptidase n=1 Tax=Flexibacterium corallicola TaxID=3037259 RepID=UPI00286F06DF|nr:P1 family peptidase [Pseudovibrio sp. M1P-2-3]
MEKTCTKPLNLITDVQGIKVGNAHDANVKTGVSIVMGDEPFVTSAAIHGGAPGTRDVALLEPEQTVDGVDALFLSGGSAFGLESGTGIQNALAKMGRGFDVGGIRIPIVPGAILFDLLNGGNKNWGDISPYNSLGKQAVANAATDFALGSAGAGFGATTADLKGGLGSASTRLSNGATVGALVAVNALGRTTIGSTAHFWAAPFEKGNEFGGKGYPSPMPEDAHKVVTKLPASGDEPTAGSNTTIAIVATDLPLTKAEAKRLAVAAHDGLSRAIWPSHTPLDGDMVFAVSTGKVGNAPALPEFLELCAVAASTLSRAVARGIYNASPMESDLMPTWKSKFGSK